MHAPESEQRRDVEVREEGLGERVTTTLPDPQDEDPGRGLQILNSKQHKFVTLQIANLET